MSEVRIAAEPRNEFGKGAARRVRRENKVPVVLYGHGDETRHFSLPGHELMLALKHDANVLLTLETPQGDQLALPKVIVRHPIRGHVEHLDLLAVRRGEKVTVDLAITLTGEAAEGVLVDLQTQTLSVSAEATHLPEGVEVSIEGLAVGGHISAGDVPLPSGATLAQDADAVVVQGLVAPTAADVDAELSASEAEIGAGAAGAAQDLQESVETGSESDKTGEGDTVGETEARRSETPAE